MLVVHPSNDTNVTTAPAHWTWNNDTDATMCAIQYIIYSHGQKFWEWHQYTFSQSLLPQFVWWQFAYTPECYEEWSDELQLMAKSLFAMQINWIPKKHVQRISALQQKDQLTSCQWFSC